MRGEGLAIQERAGKRKGVGEGWGRGKKEKSQENYNNKRRGCKNKGGFLKGEEHQTLALNRSNGD